MRIEHVKTDAFRVFDAEGFDPILVVFQDLGDGRGHLLIECYGWAWSAYWGAMGTTVRDFVDRCGVDYVVNRLVNGQRRVTSVEMKRLEGIVRAVKAAIRSDALAQETVPAPEQSIVKAFERSPRRVDESTEACLTKVRQHFNCDCTTDSALECSFRAMKECQCKCHTANR